MQLMQLLPTKIHCSSIPTSFDVLVVHYIAKSSSRCLILKIFPWLGAKSVPIYVSKINNNICWQNQYQHLLAKLIPISVIKINTNICRQNQYQYLSGAETRLYVPGRGGPLVWGDMEGRYIHNHESISSTIITKAVQKTLDVNKKTIMNIIAFLCYGCPKSQLGRGVETRCLNI